MLNMTTLLQCELYNCFILRMCSWVCSYLLFIIIYCRFLCIVLTACLFEVWLPSGMLHLIVLEKLTWHFRGAYCPCHCGDELSSLSPWCGSSEHLWNTGQFLPDYKVQHPWWLVFFILVTMRTWNITRLQCSCASSSK